jgi:hypothetical protein
MSALTRNLLRDPAGSILPLQQWDEIWSRYVGYPIPLLTAIGLNLLPGWGRASNIGLNPDVDTATLPEDAWEGGGLFNWITTPTQCQIRSTDPGDTVGGPGMQTVGLSTLNSNLAPEFLDSRGFPSTRAISLNGTTPVQLPTLIGGNNGLAGILAGSNETNIGDIILEDTVGGTLRGIIKAGQGYAHQAPYVVPTGFTLIVPQLLISVNKPNGTNPQFVSVKTYFKGAGSACSRYTLPISASSNVPYPHQIDPPIVLPEKFRFSMRIVDVGADNAIITAAWNGALRQNAAPTT